MGNAGLMSSNVVCDPKSHPKPSTLNKLGVKVIGVGTLQGFGVWRVGFRVLGLGFRVLGFGFRVLGFGF